MNRIILILLLLVLELIAVEIPTEIATSRAFGKSVQFNAKIVQLSNAQQSITSLIDGHVEKYFVKPGQKVKKGEKIALVDSITLSQMSSDYISLQEQFKVLEKNYNSTKKLYDAGMASMRDVNTQAIEKNAMLSKINALKSQLETLRIKPDKLKKTTSEYILYAHSEGTVFELLQSQHSGISANTPIVSIVKDKAFFVQSYLPLRYASSIKVGQRAVIEVNERSVMTHVTQILPQVDEVTQRIIVLSSIDENVDNLFVNTYVPLTLYFDAKEKYVAVKKSALSFFSNEWVVFIPENEEHGEYNEQDDEGEEHSEHDENEEESAPYSIRVVEVITSDNEFTAVKGLSEGEEYVSDKSYYVKSMLLKSSLGDGD